MLECLALGDKAMFEYFANEEYSFIKHLIGYGIIEEVDGNYDFKIDAIKDYLMRKNEYKAIHTSKEEKWSNLCINRGNLEINLRKMVRQVILIAYKGKSEAKEHVISKIYGDKRHKYSTYSYEDLFDSMKSEIYLKNIATLMRCNWEYFAPFYEGQNIEDFTNNMNVLNKEGRFEAHAKIPDDDDMILFYAAVNKVDSGYRKYKELYS
jgi:hypothetical protein